MSELVVHPGMPKTGTSAIQSFLHMNRARLAQEGISSPDAVLSDTSPRHQKAFSALLSGKHEWNRWVEKALRGAQKTIVSHEGICTNLTNLSDRRIRINNIDIRVIALFRPRSAFLKSLYKQLVVNPPFPSPIFTAQSWFGTDASFDTFSRSSYATFMGNRERVETALQTLFPGARLQTLDYNPDNAVQNFMSAVRGTFHALPENEGRVQVNTSLPDVCIEVIRQANALDPAFARYARSLVARTGSATNIQLAIEAANAGWQPRFANMMDVFHYQENPPLQYSEDDFEALLGTLREIEARDRSPQPRKDLP